MHVYRMHPKTFLELSAVKSPDDRVTTARALILDGSCEPGKLHYESLRDAARTVESHPENLALEESCPSCGSLSPAERRDAMPSEPYGFPSKCYHRWHDLPRPIDA